MNINIQCKQGFQALGLVRVEGSMNRGTVNILVKRPLEDVFDLKTEDLIAITTDGVAFMVIYGKEIHPFHLSCIMHSIHLCVCDVLYGKYSVQANVEGEVEGDGDTHRDRRTRVR